jgi:hypothetical protein
MLVKFTCLTFEPIKRLLMKYSFFVLTFCLALISCQKDSNEQTKTELLTSADWKYDNGGIGDANGNILFDFSTLGVTIPVCSLDNTIHFSSNGSGTISENANVCSGAPATTNFTWGFLSGETVLNVSSNAIAGLGGDFKLKELSSTKLTLLKDTTVSGIGSVTAIFNLKH